MSKETQGEQANSEEEIVNIAKDLSSIDDLKVIGYNSADMVKLSRFFEVPQFSELCDAGQLTQEMVDKIVDNKELNLPKTFFIQLTYGEGKGAFLLIKDGKLSVTSGGFGTIYDNGIFSYIKELKFQKNFERNIVLGKHI